MDNQGHPTGDLAKAIFYIPCITGTLSIMGSSTIIYSILSDRERRLSRIYHRLLLGMSIFDIVFSVAKVASTMPIPKDTIPNIYGASGNQATCNAQGFFIQFASGTQVYNAALCIYYLLVIKYGKSDAYISKTIEPIMHSVAISFPFVTATVALCKGLFNASIVGCWILHRY